MQTLLEAIRYFSDEAKCVEFIAQMKWDEGKPACPKCGSMNVVGLKTRPVYQCKEQLCKKQFSVKVGTIFQDCNVALSKFLPCMWLICNAKNGISSCEVARALGVTQKTAWFMLHRCREIFEADNAQKLSGHVEIDETYVGGKTKFMHRAKREAMKVRRRASQNDKTVVFGLLQRNGEVRAKVVDNARRHHLIPEIHANVEFGSEVSTDKLNTYNVLGEHYKHGVVDHNIAYVNGIAHTNGLENFWCLFKRSVKGTYTKIAGFHTDAYLDEQTFRFNNRKLDDIGRFSKAMSQVFGHKLTYTELITR